MKHEEVETMLLIILACCGFGMVFSACAQLYVMATT